MFSTVVARVRLRASGAIIDEHDKARDQRCCPETTSPIFDFRAHFRAGQELTMHPFRAFMLSFALGSAALFGGYGLVVEMIPAPVAHTITV
jgi:hypothetical protein